MCQMLAQFSTARCANWIIASHSKISSKMFKNLCLGVFLVACLAGLVQARPSYLPAATIVPTYEHFEYTPTVVGHSVHSIPTAVSHQSQTIVHEKRPYLRPIVKPILNTYALPLTYSPHSHYSGLYDYGWSPSLGSVYDGWNAGTHSLGSVYDGWNGWPLK